MFPSFPHLAEAIAAERAADFQRDAAAYRRARGVRRAGRQHPSLRAHRERRDIAATMARCESCAP
jgi:hypothetical protein